MPTLRLFCSLHQGKVDNLTASAHPNPVLNTLSPTQLARARLFNFVAIGCAAAVIIAWLALDWMTVNDSTRTGLGMLSSLGDGVSGLWRIPWIVPLAGAVGIYAAFRASLDLQDTRLSALKLAAGMMGLAYFIVFFAQTGYKPINLFGGEVVHSGFWIGFLASLGLVLFSGISWSTGVIWICGAFIVWFIVAERQGLGALIDWLVAGVRKFPSGISSVVSYYGDLEIGLLWPSLLIGLIAGIGLTLLVARMRATAEESTDAPLRGNRITRLMLAGGLGGIIGSQLLTYTTRHCTYAADIDAAQRILGWAITLIGVLVALLPVWTVMFRKPDLRNTGRAGYFRGRSLPYLFLVPSVLSLLVFLYIPGIQILTLSLKLRRNPLPQERFVCLQNYVNLAQDTIYQNSFITTFAIMIMLVVFSMSVALGIAVLASQKVRGASIYRTLLIWPYALSPVVTGVIFLSMFRQGRAGLINAGLWEVFSIEPNWLTDRYLAVVVIVLAAVWNALGFNILFYIAGLQNIPKDLLEAAEIDGANRVQRFARITFPLLSPFTFFLLVTNITFAFYGIYGAIDTLTKGGPPLGPAGIDGGATNVLIYKLYQDAFTPGSPAGAAAAQAVILFLMVAMITLLQFRFIEQRVTYAE